MMEDDDDIQTLSVITPPMRTPPRTPAKKNEPCDPDPDTTYEFSSEIDLSVLIDQELEKLDIATVLRREIDPICQHVSLLEEEKAIIESIFQEASRSLQQVRTQYEDEERELSKRLEEQLREEATIVIDDEIVIDDDDDDDAADSSNATSDPDGDDQDAVEIIDDDVTPTAPPSNGKSNVVHDDKSHDSEDDVQIIDTTYEQPRQSSASFDASSKSSSCVIQVNGPLDSAQLAKLADGQLIQMVNDDGKKIKTYRVRKVPFYQTQPRATLRPPTVGDKVHCMKKHEIWYRATLIDIVGSGEQTLYRVKFDGKGIRHAATGKEIAWHNPQKLPLGTRCIARYREEDKLPRYYAGITAEPPSTRNNSRYLVFFDDGYAQYSPADEVLQVYQQSSNVWEDVGAASRDFIRTYLEQYPERPMVRLQKNQVVKTEWNGKWWTARVQEVDASLVKMFFDADRRTEWIYRGSTRLAPLYTELANAEAAKMSGKPRRNMVQKAGNRPFVEYMRGNENEAESADVILCDDPKNESAPARRVSQSEPNASASTSRLVAPHAVEERRAVAKKSTASSRVVYQIVSKEVPPKAPHPPSADAPPVLRREIHPALKQRKSDGIDEEALGERVELSADKLKTCPPRPRFPTHACSPSCLNGHAGSPELHKGRNPLIIPMFFGWERQIARLRTTPTKRHTYYCGPCGRRMRNIQEVDWYLQTTGSLLSIDMFCFDYSIHPFIEFRPVKTYCDIKDLSYGKENVPISCVNGCDRNYPDYVEYSNQRLPAKGVSLNLDQNFLCGCDCQDDCRDRNKCACRQWTVQLTGATREATIDPNAGYDYRRLKEPILTGVYECNSQCRCGPRCHNRLAQNGLQLRLQVFKTEKRGWGLRCLDDIPEGGFVCIYAGQLLTDAAANEDGHQYGDEYLAELDHIEMIAGLKEGYEEDVVEPLDGSDDDFRASDSNYSGDSGPDMRSRDFGPRRRSKRTCRKSSAVKANINKLHQSADNLSLDDDNLPDLVGKKATTSTNPRLVESDDSDDDNERISRLSQMPDPKLLKGRQTPNKPDKNYGFINPRKYFGEESCYIMDAKSIGNIGRYLNHSCEPNIFVQNVFVDTHDLRFPWVAFFASENIRAGTELTWDYNYEVDSVPNKILWCYCGSVKCRGRLL